MLVEELLDSHKGHCSIKFNNFSKAMFQKVTYVFPIPSFSSQFSVCNARK